MQQNERFRVFRNAKTASTEDGYDWRMAKTLGLGGFGTCTLWVKVHENKAKMADVSKPIYHEEKKEAWNGIV